MNNKQNEMDHIIQFCACANLRKAARIVTQRYEKQMQSTGLKVTQFYMLVNITHHKVISISKLGEIMLLDQTTVTRNVNVLQKSGYVYITKDKNDSRTKSISITDAGIDKLEEATPIWLEIQENIESRIGKEKYANLLEALTDLQEVVGAY
ncbi:winged helix-turn-helix transcriptional regulator [Virgibacillus sp. NKC19-16]|uniref:MarR family winged helix-turn-helix transcriptional regulator n=1 Tax=Virgibacillus salidurans TaxID=2831673 RepID=UPI001F1CB9E7|nr:MarR family winged helix-turn-helix transcriptional regulator [Virgibacillus sp. NKC19-16]UJL46658.1 winged helix-turn-helix transcriptional regulator [Virgibacillus sp. NKC19-16]